MTNEMIAPAMQLADTNAIWSVVCDGGPMWPSIIMMVWMILIPVAPIVSLILCVRAWRRHNRGRVSPRTGRIIMGVALLVITVSVLHVLHGLNAAFYFAGTSVLGTAQQAMILLVVSHSCTMLIVGCWACFMCLLCALCLPIRNSNKNAANQASDAIGAEAAPQHQR
jgi:hypothetical protein